MDNLSGLPNTAPDAMAQVSAWHQRPAAKGGYADINALTVDVEDYFQVEAFFKLVDRSEWDTRECRVERNMDRILDLFSASGAKGTFFTLGWVAERYPAIVRAIVAEGHELASHGLAHYRADSQTPDEFIKDVSQAKAILEDTGGVAISGYRAASFSISERNLWAYDCLVEAGYGYSSSVYPIHHDLYGVPLAPRFPFRPLADQSFVEIPITTVTRFGRKFPCGGGGYFRLLPYWLSRANMASVQRRDAQPCIFYFHPWEIDPAQPVIGGASLKTRIRHYLNLDKMERRLRQLLRDFRWGRVDEVYALPAGHVSADAVGQR